MNKRMSKHKNKTLAMLLAIVFGGVGAHRVYLYGIRDFWLWNYLLALAIFISALVLVQKPHSFTISLLALLPVSIFAGWVEAMVIGLTPDKRWDAKHNAHSSRQSASGWPVVALLVLTFACGFTTFIVCIARLTDIFLTGGAYG